MVFIFSLFTACQDNSEPEGLAPNQLSGQVTLPDQTDHRGIVVYLSGLNVGTTTDETGGFILTLDDSIDTRGI